MAAGLIPVNLTKPRIRASRHEVGRLIGYAMATYGLFVSMSSLLQLRQLVQIVHNILFASSPASFALWIPTDLPRAGLGLLSIIAGIATIQRPHRVLLASWLFTGGAMIWSLAYVCGLIEFMGNQSQCFRIDQYGQCLLVFAMPVACIVAILVLRKMRSFEAAEQGLGPACSQCGYSLIGLSEPRCPECGRAYTLDEFYRLPPV